MFRFDVVNVNVECQ